MVKLSAFTPSRRCLQPGTRLPDSWFVNFVCLLLTKSSAYEEWGYAEDAALYNFNLLNVMRVHADVFEEEGYARVCARGVHAIRKITGDEGVEDMTVPVALEDVAMNAHGFPVFRFDANGPDLVSSGSAVVEVQNGRAPAPVPALELFPDARLHALDVCERSPLDRKRKRAPPSAPVAARATKVRFVLRGDRVPERTQKRRSPSRIFPYGTISAEPLDYASGTPASSSEVSVRVDMSSDAGL